MSGNLGNRHKADRQLRTISDQSPTHAVRKVAATTCRRGNCRGLRSLIVPRRRRAKLHRAIERGYVTRTPGRAHSFSVEGVAKNFRFDWQFLIATSRINSALSLATLFSLLAIVTKFADLVNLGMPALSC